MRSVKYMEEEAVIKKAMEVLIKELGPVEAIRFINIPRRKGGKRKKAPRMAEIIRQGRFFKEVFGGNARNRATREIR